MLLQQNKRRSFAALALVVVLLAIGFLAGTVTSGNATPPAVTRTVTHTLTATTTVTSPKQTSEIARLGRRDSRLTGQLRAVRRCLAHRRQVHCVKAIVH